MVWFVRYLRKYEHSGTLIVLSSVRLLMSSMTNDRRACPWPIRWSLQGLLGMLALKLMVLHAYKCSYYAKSTPWLWEGVSVSRSKVSSEDSFNYKGAYQVDNVGRRQLVHSDVQRLVDNGAHIPPSIVANWHAKTRGKEIYKCFKTTQQHKGEIELSAMQKWQEGSSSSSHKWGTIWNVYLLLSELFV